MTNAELIKALKDAEMYINYVAPACYAAVEAKEAIRAAADAIEAADKRIAELEPKRGECKKLLRNQWINYYECSICGNMFDAAVNYCPNCGARMRGEHDGTLD